ELRPGQLLSWEVERIGVHSVHAVMRVVDVRPVPDTDLGDGDRGDQHRPPHYLQVIDPATGKRSHYRCRPSARVLLLETHHPKCAECGGLWPCRDNLIEIHLAQAAQRMDRECVVCHRADGWRVAEVRTETPDGVAVARYHTRKGSRCRAEYIRAVSGDLVALAALRREDAQYAAVLRRAR